jgi:hypothetical protein
VRLHDPDACEWLCFFDFEEAEGEAGSPVTIVRRCRAAVRCQVWPLAYPSRYPAL